MFEKTGNFLREENGQGAIEYIMLAGGIIVAAIIIFVIYKRAAASAGAKLSASVNQTAAGENKAISTRLAKLQ
ncbi:hypothetical protein IPdc08_00659 [archaeon]|nr:hypothetical protein IPdc08_00659 [archaeon]